MLDNFGNISFFPRAPENIGKSENIKIIHCRKT